MTETAETPRQSFARLRDWVRAHCQDENPVRETAIALSRGALINRLLKFGVDETLNACSAREVMALLVYVNGLLAEYLMRLAYTRALIEGDHEVYETLNAFPFIEDVRRWYFQIVEAMMGRSPEPEVATIWVQNMRGEERSVARLIIGRVWPDVAQPEWLDELPEPDSMPMERLSVEMLRVVAQAHPDAARNHLAKHPGLRWVATRAAEQPDTGPKQPALSPG